MGGGKGEWMEDREGPRVWGPVSRRADRTETGADVHCKVSVKQSLQTRPEETLADVCPSHEDFCTIDHRPM